MPILTKFAPAEGNEDSEVPQSSMTTLACLEAPVEAKNIANQTGDSDGEDENAAVAVVPHGSVAWMIGAVVAGIAAFI